MLERENISCLWNDVICLQDEQAVTFVCKALFQINVYQEGDYLEQLEAIDISVGKSETAAWGEAFCQTLLERKDGKKETLELKLPFIKEERQTKEVEYFQMHYLQGRLLKDKLWVEAVISGAVSKEKGKEIVELGEMALSEKLILASELSACGQIISTQVESILEDVRKNEESIAVRGKHRISLLYEAIGNEGEKLHIYQQENSFEGELAMVSDFDSWQKAHVTYRMITAQQLGEREINVSGIGNITAVREEEREGEEEDVLPSASKKSELKNVQRKSSRTNLEKYMRELDSLVNEEIILRNFDLQDK